MLSLVKSNSLFQLVDVELLIYGEYVCDDFEVFFDCFNKNMYSSFWVNVMMGLWWGRVFSGIFGWVTIVVVVVIVVVIVVIVVVTPIGLGSMPTYDFIDWLNIFLLIYKFVYKIFCLEDYKIWISIYLFVHKKIILLARFKTLTLLY